MAETVSIDITIPSSLGLSQDQINQLKENFRNDLIATIRGTSAQPQTTAGSAVRARPQVEQVPRVIDVQ